MDYIMEVTIIKRQLQINFMNSGTVLKEVKINALSHCDNYDQYFTTTKEPFKDHEEITNPGGMASTINPNTAKLKVNSKNYII